MRYPADHKAEERAALLRAGTRSVRVAGAPMLGAVSISRATSDAATQAKVLDAARKPAGRLISPGKKPK